MTTLDDVLPVILGAGGAGMVAAIAQALSSWRNGVEQREHRAVGNLERWRIDADARAERLQHALDLAFDALRAERAWSGHLEYTMRAAGMDLPARPPDTPAREGQA